MVKGYYEASNSYLEAFDGDTTTVSGTDVNLAFGRSHVEAHFDSLYVIDSIVILFDSVKYDGSILDFVSYVEGEDDFSGLERVYVPEGKGHRMTYVPDPDNFYIIDTFSMISIEFHSFTIREILIYGNPVGFEKCPCESEFNDLMDEVIIDDFITSMDDVEVEESEILYAFDMSGRPVPIDTRGQAIILWYSNGNREKVYKP